MFSEFFIRRPIFASVISIIIIVVGIVGLMSLPVARYPDIAPPTITVSATYPGADASTVSDTVASPIETEVNGVENMLYMSSVCGNDGSMRLTVTFEPGTDLDTANVLVQNRVSLAENRLPEEVRRQGVSVKKQSSDTALYIALTSEKDAKTGKAKYDAAFLSNYASIQLRDELARVNGVGDVTIYGVGELSMRIWLDMEKLSERNIAPAEVVAAVRNQNAQVAAGRIGAPPTTQTGSDLEYIVTTPGRLATVEQFKNIILKTTDDKRILRLKDVARVEQGSKTYATSSTVNGAQASTIAVSQIPGTNVIDVVDGVKNKLSELSKSFPEGVHAKVIYDSTDVVNASIHEVVLTLILTLLLVVLTVYVFLQSVRATIIPTVTIPVSLIGTFAVLLAMGYSINQFTLFGLVLVIGIVVDDAIIVVENVMRHIQEGKSPLDAAIISMREVSGPVVATTLVLLVVFVPTVFIPGITGTLFKQFAVTISIATLFSSLNALTLSPALCAVLLKANPKKPGKLFGIFNRGVKKSTNATASVVALAIRRSVIGVLLFAVIVAIAVIGYGRLPSGFVPQEDEGYCMVSVQLPDGASLERTSEMLKKASALIEKTEGVQDVLAIGGYSLIDGAAAPNSGMMVVIFKNWEERPVPQQHQNAIIQKMNRSLASLGDGLAFAFPMPSLPGLGTSSGFTYMLQDQKGTGIDNLQKTAAEIIHDGNAQTGLEGLRTTYRATAPKLNIDIDREQVAARGVKIADVYDTLSVALGSAYINDYTQFGRVFQVKAQADASFRMDPNDIKHLKVKNAQGTMIPLGTFCKVDEVLGPQTITRFNLYPAIKITGQAATGFSSGEALHIMEDMSAKKLPNGMGFSWSDLSFQESKINPMAMAGIFGFSILMVYLVLAAQYESWSIPVSVCLSVPTALLGAVIGLSSRGMTNNIYTQVGVVLLIGLATKSAILIVEFAMEERAKGKPIHEAAQQAIQIRFRAVMMTAVAFVLGVIPLVVASGAGAESRKVLGTTVCFGLIAATIISIIAVPMLYAVIQSISEWVSGKKKTED